MTALELRPYQEECIEQALDRQNLLIAMVMGSGKTAAVLRTIRQLRKEGEVLSGCVFALNSTKFQWMAEIKKWDPGATAHVVDGTKMARTIQLRHGPRFHYTILHYECLVNDWDTIKKYLPVDFIICDEITAIKSFVAKRSRRLKSMRKATPYRYGLSGQPVENRPEELFSIMEFIDPDVLGDFAKFDRTFIKRNPWGRPTGYVNLPTLYKVMSKAMFRKSRDDIKEWLPDLVSMEIPVKLGPKPMALHDLIRDDLIEAIDKAMASGAAGGFDLLVHYGKGQKSSFQNASMKGEVMARLLAMRMVASHPQLLTWSASNFDSPDISSGSQYASTLRKQGALTGLSLKHEKLDALLEMVEEILAEDPRHKVVIFSYFKPMLRIIGQEITRRKLSAYVTLTGDVLARDRWKHITRFTDDPTCRVFLSSDAGAYGVDLNTGSHLICYDLPWSAGILAQRISRIDRTSSAWEGITVVYMYGQHTIEERMYHQLAEKMAVAGAWLDGKYDEKTGSLPLSYESLRDFLLGC